MIDHDLAIGDIVDCNCGCGNVYLVAGLLDEDPAGTVALVRMVKSSGTSDYTTDAISAEFLVAHVTPVRILDEL